MKKLATFAPLAAVLGLVFFLSACTTPQSARVTRPRPVAEFTVVESSTKKELTPAQLAELRDAVADYLHEQGLADNRVYYVKIAFSGETPEDEGQWAIIRIGNLPKRTYTILAAYPGPDDYYPYDYYGYNTGFNGLARYGYYDPFDYNYGYYNRPAPRRDHHPDDRPGDKPDRPRTTPTGWDNHRPDPDHSRPDRPRTPTPAPPVARDHDRPDNPTPRTTTRNRSDDGGRDAGGTRDWGRDHSSGGSSSPAPVYTPPPAPVRSAPPPRNESPSPMQSGRDKSDPPTNEK